MTMKQLKDIAVLVFTVMLLPIAIACGGDDAKEGDKNSATNPENSDTYVYFIRPYPVRTIVLGTNTLDNEHKYEIIATIGGNTYKSIKGYVELAVDESLVKNLYMEDGITPVKAMPRNYYNLSSSTIGFDNASSAGVIVDLSDAFFKDPDAVKNTYVIPLVMKNQMGLGKIKTGKLKEGQSGSRTNPNVWDEQPMDFVLSCVKYINKYSGIWLTNGTNSINELSIHKNHGEVKSVTIKTKGLNECILSVSYQDGSKDYKADLLLAFDSNGDCTISSLTSGVTVIGKGKWQRLGAKKEITGFKTDEDLLELLYKVDLGNGHVWTIHEKLVGDERGDRLEYLSPVYRD